MPTLMFWLKLGEFRLLSIGPNSASGLWVGGAVVLMGEDKGVLFWMRRGWIWFHGSVLSLGEPAHCQHSLMDGKTYGLRHDGNPS